MLKKQILNGLSKQWKISFSEFNAHALPCLSTTVLRVNISTQIYSAIKVWSTHGYNRMTPINIPPKSTLPPLCPASTGFPLTF